MEIKMPEMDEKSIVLAFINANISTLVRLGKDEVERMEELIALVRKNAWKEK